MFYAHILLKFVAVGGEKYTLEKDGFDGFGVNAQVIKSRTNQAGQDCSLIYDKIKGIDSERTSVNYAKDNGLTGGNRNAMYFIDDKDTKFSLNNLHDCFRSNPELYKKMYGLIIPTLEQRLSALTTEELQQNEHVMEY